MRKVWSSLTILLQVYFTYLTSAATLPPSLQLVNNANLLSNGSSAYIQCLPRPNVTYPIYDSPLDLAMTFGHRPILSWQLTTFLRYVLISIKRNAADNPHAYLPDGYYYYHEPGHLGAVVVVPSFFHNFTWSDLYLVLHGLAEYVVTAPSAYEMCVEIIFRAGGLAGVIFIEWWTKDVPTIRNPLHVRDATNRHLLELDS